MSRQIDLVKAAALKELLQQLQSKIVEVMPPGLPSSVLETEPYASLSQVSFYAEEARFYLGHDQQVHTAPSRSQTSRQD